jgi:hypothetical protein
MPTTITPAQARRELRRRSAPKGSDKRNNRPAQHIFQASGSELKALAAVSPAPAPVAKVTPKPAPKPVNVRARVGKLAFEHAAAAAADGERIKAGIKARAAALAAYDANVAAAA